MNSVEMVVLNSKDPIPDQGQSIIDAIGRLMANCGQIEGFSKSWIWELEPDETKRQKLCRHFWKRRIKGLKILIDIQNYHDEFKRKLIQLIEDSNELMDFRNSVAHGSLYVIGASDARLYDSQLTEEHPTGKFIIVEDIKKKIDEAEGLLDKWIQLWQEKAG